MVSTSSSAVVPLLKQLETELRRLGLWSGQPPSPEAMASVMPFMYDTLKPYEWLQWVFIPRTQALIDAKAKLPNNSHIHPLMEHYFSRRDDINSQTLLTIVLAIDTTLNTEPSQ